MHTSYIYINHIYLYIGLYTYTNMDMLDIDIHILCNDVLQTLRWANGDNHPPWK